VVRDREHARTNLVGFDLAAHHVDVVVAASPHSLTAASELGFLAVEGDDPVEDRSEDLELPAVARSRVDRARPGGDERCEGREVGQQLARGIGEIVLAGLLAEKCPARRIARPNHFGHAIEAAFGEAQRAPRSQGVGHDRIFASRLGKTDQHACALFSDGDEPPWRRGTRWRETFGLRLREKIGKLADRQLFFIGERQHPEADGLGEETIELPPALDRGGRRGRLVGHVAHIHTYIHSYE